MKKLFDIDLKNYDPSWEVFSRPSARSIIFPDVPAADVAPQFADMYVSEVKVSAGFQGNRRVSGSTRIVMAYVSKYGYYKFPGGGIHDDEDKVAALIRETAEETGLEVIPESVIEAGVVGRRQKSIVTGNTVFSQDNFYYFCDVRSLVPGAQNLDDYEAEDGFEFKITTIDEAVEANMHMTSTDPFDFVMAYREARILNMLAGKQTEPSRAFAEYLLSEAAAKNPGPWEAHSLAVARAAEKIARAVNDAQVSEVKGGVDASRATARVNERDRCNNSDRSPKLVQGSLIPSLNPELAYVYGLLHDIGRQEGYTYLAHVWDGYRFLMDLGFENAARICLTHSFNLQDYDDYIGKRDVSDETAAHIRSLLESYTYDDYDRLIQVLDSTCGADGTLDLEARMSDVKVRYGYYPEGKWNKNFELKDYFEKLMGKPYYDVLRG
ncbi:MAG: NUDIX domain-containing protein [Treponema sp.]|nr:NUDIX domain-containing protein [Candidatus Treponema caballi]